MGQQVNMQLIMDSMQLGLCIRFVPNVTLRDAVVPD